jgi:tyrosyl-tRNA synthetase
LPEFFPTPDERNVISIVVKAYETAFGLKKSRSEIRRLLEQGSVQLRGEKILDPQAQPTFHSGDVLRLDKTRAVRIK